MTNKVNNKKFNILVIGERFEDYFVYGNVNRVSPESPTLILNPIKKEWNLGGAGNTYNNLKSLSPKSKVVFYHQKSLITKTRFVDENSNYILLRVDQNDFVDKDDIAISDNILKNEKIKFDKLDAIVISDYNKGFISSDFLIVLFYKAKRSNVPVFIDTKKDLNNITKGYYNRPFCIKINEKEYQNCDLYHINYLLDNADNLPNIIVTKGDKGCIWLNKNREYKVKKQESFCLAGAGDTFMAALVIKYLETKSLDNAIKFANRAASLAVSKKGVVTVSKDQI